MLCLRLPRNAIALAAAYAIALQGIFSGFAALPVAGGWTGDAAIICATGGGEDRGIPHDPQNCPCPGLCTSAGASAVLPQAAEIHPQLAGAALPVPAQDGGSQQRRPALWHSRAPPAA